MVASRFIIAALTAAILVVSIAAAQRPRRAGNASPPTTLALVGGRIHTQTDAGIVDGTVLIRAGKIVEVGSDVKIPRQARRIDVRGMSVTPGLIDARSTLWLTTSSARAGASDGSLNVLDGVDLFAEDWKEVARQGITAIYAQPSASGNLGGRGAVLRVAPARTLRQLVMKRDSAAQAALGVGSRSETSRARYTQYERVKRALTAAKEYGERWKKYEEYQQKKAKSEKSTDDSTDSDTADDAESSGQRGERRTGSRGRGPARGGPRGRPRGGPAGGSRDRPSSSTDDEESAESKGKAEQDSSDKEEEKAPPKPTRDPAKDFLLKVLNREIPLRLEAHRDDDLRNALKLVETFNVRLILEGVSQPGSALDDVVASRIPLVLGPVLRGPSGPDYLMRRGDDWLDVLTGNDVLFALSTFGDNPRESRLLRMHAAAAVAAGVSSARVLRSITRDAAALLGVEDQVGSIEAGKAADIAVFAGDPLDPSSPTRLVLSRGIIVAKSNISARPQEEHEIRPLADPLPAVYAVRSNRFLNESGQFVSHQIVVQDGRITAIGSTGDLPEDIPIFDLADSVVTPGLVTAHTDLGLANLMEDGREANSADIRAADVYDPDAILVRRFRDAGMLGAAFAPGSDNVISGNVAYVQLGSDRPIRSADSALKIVLTARSRDAGRFPASLTGQVTLVQRVLSGDDNETRILLPDIGKAELIAERRRQVDGLSDRSRPVLMEAESEAEIRAALGIIEQFDLQAALVHPADFSTFMADLKRLNVGIITRPITSRTYDREVDQLVEAARAGIPIAFGADSPESCRQTAALAVSLGLPTEHALRGLTGAGSRLVGAPRHTGRLVVGASADFVVWNGSPLNLCCQPISVVVDGDFISPN